ncbi:MAG: hypothetical protein ABH821_03135 [archaeon]
MKGKKPGIKFGERFWNNYAELTRFRLKAGRINRVKLEKLREDCVKAINSRQQVLNILLKPNNPALRINYSKVKIKEYKEIIKQIDAALGTN